MTPIRDAYLIAADSAVALINEEAVTTGWAGKSSLEGFTNGGLAALLAGQIFSVRYALVQAQPDLELVPLLGHYERASWVNADLDAEINVAIRGKGEAAATDGVQKLRDEVSSALAEIRALLPAQSADRLAPVPAGPWLLTLDDFLVTRMMEIAVHSDDLACGLGLPTPELPSNVLDPVVALLTKLSMRHHGQAALLRALTRAERAPESVTAF